MSEGETDDVVSQEGMALAGRVILMNGPSINLGRENYITLMIMIISNPIVFVVCAFVNVGGRHPSSEAGQLKY